MIKQTTFRLSPKRRGCHLVTHEILEQLPKPLPQVGMLSLFLQHTSCALTINENFDPDVRTDMDSILNHMVKEGEPYYRHTMEGPDDMPDHAKCSLFGVSLTIPITGGKLNMGTWQKRKPNWKISLTAAHSPTRNSRRHRSASVRSWNSPTKRSSDSLNFMN